MLMPNWHLLGTDEMDRQAYRCYELGVKVYYQTLAQLSNFGTLRHGICSPRSIPSSSTDLYADLADDLVRLKSHIDLGRKENIKWSIYGERTMN